eukprot:TRINITY_DN5957_c0_g1_i1.p1 TRINITY_DN5957_c0_g1~~TRINITY_DN5957_c0_g1_i1.p1  ORF type:complete len:243 (+),score=78.81 TRINITY_DN5957_c0_g1_i1:331-1059(+)
MALSNFLAPSNHPSLIFAAAFAMECFTSPLLDTFADVLAKIGAVKTLFSIVCMDSLTSDLRIQCLRTLSVISATPKTHARFWEMNALKVLNGFIATKDKGLKDGVQHAVGTMANLLVVPDQRRNYFNSSGISRILNCWSDVDSREAIACALINLCDKDPEIAREVKTQDFLKTLKNFLPTTDATQPLAKKVSQAIEIIESPDLGPAPLPPSSAPSSSSSSSSATSSSRTVTYRPKFPGYLVV